MTTVGSNEMPPKSNDKLISRVEASFRALYYGGASGSIPFTWESIPGTPKRPSNFCDNSNIHLPPLSPPPSYYTYHSPKVQTTATFKSKLCFRFFSSGVCGSKKKKLHPSSSFASSVSPMCSYYDDQVPSYRSTASLVGISGYVFRWGRSKSEVVGRR
ncbi:uncharacterized protein LOC124944270 [Impatiens glandulifera]|uniref:uncharacterized protein LOC124944270 n=1 Tax=Impatiens glandulifera TaxID=253017 RepID=UPI001FB09968|nr:uncharacterized protein LOC124944270 [Impatiens glandulifera]